MGGKEEEDGGSPFSVEVGQRLRAVRRARRMSLDDVERQSGGRWSASAIGAYERGFRNLSLPRLQELAGFYEVPMGVLLGEADVVDKSRGAKVMLDLEKLGQAAGGQAVMRYLRTIILERGDFNGRVLSVRQDDVRALCAVLQLTENELFGQLEQWGALLAGSAPEPKTPEE
jgi:transcriptional regulator with XRE-family HTH domain